MKKQPTKAQWEEIATALDSLFGGVYLRCDGYLFHAAMTRVGTNKLAIQVFVDGWVKGEWAPFNGELAEQARRFWRPVERAVYSRKDIAALEKIWGKRQCRAKGYYDKKLRWAEPIWNRPWPLIRHLQKHCDSIEILSWSEYQAALDAKRGAETMEVANATA